jgi:hypothetical protein
MGVAALGVGAEQGLLSLQSPDLQERPAVLEVLLAAGTMEAAIDLHFKILRKAARLFSGHESSTEVSRLPPPCLQSTSNCTRVVSCNML